MKMRTRLAGAAVILAFGCVATMTASGNGQSGAMDAKAAFERLKALQGTWEAPAGNGQKAITTFELVGDGSVLLERYRNPALPGGGHMVSAYHLDGAELVLTHYCIAKNQPTLRAARFDPAASAVQFEFLRAGNLPDPNAGHMRRALYRLEGADRFTTEWEFFAGGRKTMTETETFTRIKQETTR